MSAPFWTLDRLADALSGCVVANAPRGSAPINGISTDTRTIGERSAFVALAGENFDAHDFLGEAVRRGAAAVVVADAARAGGPGVPVYEVRDTLQALGALAAYRRRAWGNPVVAVTGTNGKTTTKELMRAALGSRLEVHATAGNLNNLVGLPLTLLGLPNEADIAIAEMGMSVPGEIARLRGIARPDIAVVTSVGEGHLEGMGSVEGVLREKASIFDGVGVAVAPAGQPEIVAEARKRARHVVTAGLGDGDVKAERWGLDAEGCGWLSVDGVTVRPPLRGEHNLRNAMLAIAVARECGVSLDDVARGMGGMPAPTMRVAWEPLGQATLINDAYNANPGSMRAALDLLAALDTPRQRVAALGPMRELGAHSARLHAEIARYALRSSIQVVAGVGEMGDALAGEAPSDSRVVTAPDVETLWEALEPRLSPEAIILIKASRGARLERLVPFITSWANR
ncbi:MAG: UDP-N-acetylmuramoyl-tripeptide--D-alanyl-D-alanine ligase [Gemmatimonadaceae bacterium]